MSFVIYVTLPHDDIPLPADPDQWDNWLDECNKYLVYEAPLGADGSVFYFWSSLARSLSLPLLTSIYDHGMRIEQVEGLEQLEHELDQLEHYWHTHELIDPCRYAKKWDNLQEELGERMSYFREAIKIAREQQAILSIT